MPLKELLKGLHLCVFCVVLGRCVITEHEDENDDRVCIVNVYCPMAIEENEERYTFKLNFYKLLETRCRALKEAGK